MTGASNGPTTRRVLVSAAIAFTALGVLRGSVQLAAGPRDAVDAWYLYRVTILISWFWIPIAVAVAAAWRWRRQPRRFAAALAALLVVALFGEVAWMTVVLGALAPRIVILPYAFRFIGRLDTNLLMYAAVVGAVWAAEGARRERATRLAAAKLDALLADTRLHVLTLQLHPHFLFNTLNLISQLAYRDAEAARRTLGNLRDLLVQSLSHAGARDVPLREELRFLSAYLEIQQRRFGERLRARVDVAGDALDVAVPHLLLQPLVENAIIHGLANRPEGGEIRITGQVTGDRLRLTVEDDGVGLGSSGTQERVGLSNTRLRLHQFSGDDYRFTIAPREKQGTIVAIVVPARIVDDATVAEQRDGSTGGADDRELTAEPPKRVSRYTIALQAIAGWAAIAGLWTELSAAQQFVRQTPVTWGPSIASSVGNALILAILAPLALWLVRRFDLATRRSWRRVAAHVIAAPCVAVIHVTLFLTYLREFVPGQFAIERGNRFAWCVWDVVAYGTVVAFGAVATLRARHRDAVVAMTITRSRIANARVASLRLRLQPMVLLRGLDAIGIAMSTNPEQGEHAIARMGDLLRALLAGVDRDTATLDTELATLRAFLDVVDPSAVVFTSDALAEVTVPAVLLTPLAAGLGDVARVDVGRTDHVLSVRLHARRPSLDDAHLSPLRDRLRQRYGDAAALVVEPSADGGVDVRLQLPIERPTAPDDDETALEPALVVA